MMVQRNRTMLQSQHRKMMLRVASAYRTASYEALCVITGVVLLELMVNERSRMEERRGRGEERAEEMKGTIEAWQAR